MEIKNVQANNLTTDYLNFCLSRKNLDQKTIKSYTIDLRQYFEFTMESAIEWTNKKSIEQYIDLLHCKYKPKSVKRKIASLKAFFHYLEIEELIDINPFHKIQIKYKEPFILPKTIPINNIEQIIRFAYLQLEKLHNLYFSCHIRLVYGFLSLSRREVSSSSTSSILGRADFKFSGIALLSW